MRCTTNASAYTVEGRLGDWVTLPRKAERFTLLMTMIGNMRQLYIAFSGP